MKRAYALTLMTLALTLNACVKVSTPEAQTIEHLSVNALNDSEKAPSDKAEDLALAAEELIANEEFVEARKALNLALAADSQNFRAQFWSLGLEGVELVHGYFARVAPLGRLNASTLKKYNEDVEKARKENSAKVFAYYMDGQEEIYNESDLQSKFLDRYASVGKRVRDFVEKNKNREFTFKARGQLLKNRTRSFVEACEVKVTDDLEYELTCPEKRTRLEVTLNRADFEMIKYSSSFISLYLPAYTAYDLTGVLQLAVRAGSGETFKNNELRDQLLANPTFGRYRPSSLATEARTSAQDYVGYLMYGMDNYAELCPKGQEKPGSRPGKMYEAGVCVNPQWYRAFVDTLTPYTKGPVNVTSGWNTTPYSTDTNYFAFFDNPVKDLRHLGELNFDDCGSLLSVGEPTLNGVFPKGDANKVLPLAAKKCVP